MSCMGQEKRSRDEQHDMTATKAPRPNPRPLQDTEHYKDALEWGLRKETERIAAKKGRYPQPLKDKRSFGDMVLYASGSVKVRHTYVRFTIHATIHLKKSLRSFQLNLKGTLLLIRLYCS